MSYTKLMNDEEEYFFQNTDRELDRAPDMQNQIGGKPVVADINEGGGIRQAQPNTVLREDRTRKG